MHTLRQRPLAPREPGDFGVRGSKAEVRCKRDAKMLCEGHMAGLRATRLRLSGERGWCDRRQAMRLP